MARSFRAPKRTLDGLDQDDAASLIAAASDVALVLDAKGVIRDVSLGADDLPSDLHEQWIGQTWLHTVTVESRPKVEALLRHSADAAQRRWRHINHPREHGGDLPILYTAVQVGAKGKVIAFGRDMRTASGLQQRLVDAQQSLERDFRRMRQVETRYRLLFEQSTEAILVIGEATRQVVEANPAALALLGLPERRVVGQPFPVGLDARATRALNTLLGRVRGSGKADHVDLQIDAGARATAHASMFKQDEEQFLLVRLVPQDKASPNGRGTASLVSHVVDHAPDGFVVTDPDGVVIHANPAFVDLVQLPGTGQVRGESLDRWLGRPGVDLGVLLSTLNQGGSVKLFSTTLRGEHSAPVDVEISAVAVPDSNPPCLGFTVRDVSRRLAPASAAPGSTPRSVEQLTKLVGRLPLKDLVRESTDLIEQLCIEAALEMTRDNRASAAGLLGLSRQSLYVKLRRYGLGDLNGEDNS